MRTLLFAMATFVLCSALTAKDLFTATEQAFWGGTSDRSVLSQQTTQSITASPGISIVQGMNNTNFDFQSNGGDERHLWVLPDGSVHAVYSGFANDKLGRGSFYVFSPDFGQTFSAPLRVESKAAEFPALAVTPDGRAVVVSHKATDPRSLYFQIDFQKGMGFFLATDIPDDPPNYALARVAVPTNNMAVFSAYSRLGINSVWNAFDFQANTFLHQQNQEMFPGVSGNYGFTHALAKSANGKVALVMVNYLAWGKNDWARENDFGENGIIVRESLDGGLTFGDPVDVTHYGNASRSLHNHVWLIGLSAMYVGEDLHLTWVEQTIEDVHNIPHEATRIMHWSPAVNGGNPSVAVAWDSEHFAYWEGDPQIAPLDFPHIGADANGVLSIVFCSFPPDISATDSTTGYLYSDIFAVSSADNGHMWGEPVNLTNTPYLDDRFPYISEWNEAGKINVLYQTDTKTGQISQGSHYVGEVDHLFLKTDRPATKQITFEDDHFWQTVTQMQTPRFFCTATKIDSMIYVLGGSQCTEAMPFSSVGMNEAFDTVTNTWTTLAPMPTPRSDHAACSYNGKIYVLGGYASIEHNTLPTVEVYDPATDTWEQKSDMPVARSGFVAFVYNNQIYTIGGRKQESDASELAGALAIYDPATDTWSMHNSPNLPAYDFAACVVGDHLCAAGGIGSVEEPGMLSGQSFVLNLQAQAFDLMSRITASRCYLTSAFLNDAIYYIGGSTQSYPQNDAQATVDIFLPNDKVWLAGKELPSSRYGHASCVVNNRIYVFGGKTSQNENADWNADVDVYTATLISDIGNTKTNLPASFQLYQNFPNPFNPSTTITFDCPVTSFVRLDIFDLLGRRIQCLVDENRHAGRYAEVWDARDESGRPVSSGVYVAVLKAETFERSIKLVVMK